MKFTTKDSGKRQTFESGMKRDTQDGKTLYHLVFDGPMFERDAQLLTRGAVKYGERNWLKATGQAELDRFKASAVRHFIQWLRGDEDEDHAAAVRFNINGAEYVKEKMLRSTASDRAAVAAAPDGAAVFVSDPSAVDLDKCGTIDGVTPLSQIGCCYDGYWGYGLLEYRLTGTCTPTPEVTFVGLDGVRRKSDFPFDLIKDGINSGEYIFLRAL